MENVEKYVENDVENINVDEEVGGFDVSDEDWKKGFEEAEGLL